METVAVYCGGARCGDALLRERGDRVEIRAELEDPGDGLYRAVLVCRRGELSLGVMQPQQGKLVLLRRPERCEISRLGGVSHVQVGCSFSFGNKPRWNAEREPSRLLQSDFWQARLEQYHQAWWRREGDSLLLALPLREGEPFPLETIFCFARTERVGGEPCVVYRFDGQEQPVMPETAEKNKKR